MGGFAAGGGAAVVVFLCSLGMEGEDAAELFSGEGDADAVGAGAGCGVVQAVTPSTTARAAALRGGLFLAGSPIGVLW